MDHFSIETLLPIYILQVWNIFPDLAMKEALCNTPDDRWFVGLDSGASRLPYETDNSAVSTFPQRVLPRQDHFGRGQPVPPIRGILAHKRYHD
jgi:hypothetical protein